MVTFRKKHNWWLSCIIIRVISLNLDNLSAIKNFLFDGRYSGKNFADSVKDIHGATVEVVKKKGFAWIYGDSKALDCWTYLCLARKKLQTLEKSWTQIWCFSPNDCFILTCPHSQKILDTFLDYTFCND